MTLSFFEFLSVVGKNPVLLFSVVLTVVVIFVNGWTDAPNAIAVCVSTRAIGINSAIIMAAVCNLSGAVIITFLNTSVSMTIKNIVDFGEDNKRASIALCASMVAIIMWSVAAWFAAIPTSESHALIAGLSGAALALDGGFQNINISEWIKVINGLIISTVAGLVLGYIFSKIISVLLCNSDRRKAQNYLNIAQIFGGAFTAFFHGAQDGQKFIGVILLCISFTENVKTDFAPFWAVIACSVIMTAGTAAGGRKIIKSVGMNMVKLEKYQGVAADLASGLCMVFASFTGIPLSTTHTKTSSVMGAGASNGLHTVNFKIIIDMITAWVLTFPGCGIIGFLAAEILLYFL